MTPFKKLAIVGLGHIGSSIAHAARRGDLALEISGFDASEDVRLRARKIGFATIVHDDIAAAELAADRCSKNRKTVKKTSTSNV